jgi:bifunctional non-homologous end joining protein LigD
MWVHRFAMSDLRFIPPAIPVTKLALPRGDAWLHEPKLDGCRHSADARGFDCTRRFPDIAESLQCLPASLAILDGALVSVGEDGLPDYRRGAAPLHGLR